MESCSLMVSKQDYTRWRGGGGWGRGEGRGRKERNEVTAEWRIEINTFIHLENKKSTNKQTKQLKLEIQNFMNTSLFQALCYPSTCALNFSRPGKLGGFNLRTHIFWRRHRRKHVTHFSMSREDRTCTNSFGYPLNSTGWFTSVN